MLLNIPVRERESFFEQLETREADIRATKGAKYANAGTAADYNTVNHFNKLSAVSGVSPARIAWLMCQKSLDGFKYHLQQLSTLLETGPRPNYHELLTTETNELIEYANDVRNYVGFTAMLLTGEAEFALPPVLETQPAEET